MSALNQIQNFDAYSGLLQMADRAVQCIITSPPYFKLRNYGTKPVSWQKVSFSVFGFPVTIPAMECELGQEPDPFSFIGHLIIIFREAHRVLKDDGVLWLNMGDSYASNPQKNDNLFLDPKIPNRNGGERARFKNALIKPKDLIGIPWLLAFALRDDGWFLRQDIIWSKPNCTPESVTDRCTKSHEYIFMLTKTNKYYFDSKAIRTLSKTKVLSWEEKRKNEGDPVRAGFSQSMPALNRKSKTKIRGHRSPHAGFDKKWDKMTTKEQMSNGANKRSVWTCDNDYSVWEWLFQNAPFEVISPLWVKFISETTSKSSVWTVATRALRKAHFATFPEKLVTDMIKSSSKLDDTILDTFMGAGTTGLVSRKLQRNFIGFELKPEYIEIADERLTQSLGIFK